VSIRERVGPYIPQAIVKLKNRIKYYGTQYHCPICPTNLRLFLPLPDKFRVNISINDQTYTPHDYETFNVEQYLCPVCLYALFIDRYINDSGTNKKLLHFAPEKELSNYIKRKRMFRYRTADLLMRDVDDRVDITNLVNYHDGEFDCFICSHILEHVPDDTKALQELHRVLNPSGWGIIMVPLLPTLARTYQDLSITTGRERLRQFGQEDHVRVYAKKSFLKKLDNAGFDVLQLGVADFGEETFNKCGIKQKSILYIVTKRQVK
jgi:predicted SAM-dependent methyltransferase